ncbi:MAG TPA: hypothetical protein VEF53_02545, partial [Patescibacteria group bacterium]|nr:hypothetical protein [Patescibacteria group bacterium]
IFTSCTLNHQLLEKFFRIFSVYGGCVNLETPSRIISSGVFLKSGFLTCMSGIRLPLGAPFMNKLSQYLIKFIVPGTAFKPYYQLLGIHTIIMDKLFSLG